MQAEQYAHALLESYDRAPEEEREAVLDRFIALLGARGHRALLPSILRATERILGTTERGAVVRVARETDLALHRNDIQDCVARIGAREYRTEIAPELIGGFRVETPHVRFDASYLQQLIALYRRFVS